MKDWQKLVVKPHTTIRDVIGIIDVSGLQTAVVADDNGRLVGTITDGDVRRGILRGVDLTQPAELVMNKNPITMLAGETRKQALKNLKGRHITVLPVINADRELQSIEILSEITKPAPLDHGVVLMAGGKGSRLGAITEDCPKPLIKVGDKPILETIINGFSECGFQNFYLAVNYKAAMIYDYFGDGSRLGVNIQYIQEEQQLGTAGALSLLPENLVRPVIVMNGDVLTKVNFAQLLEAHIDQNTDATMCVREYDFEVPYGVVQIEDETIRSIDEKPIQRFFVNAGIYVLNPDVIKMIPKKTRIDMTALFQEAIKAKKKTRVFPIREYWLDVGRASDLERASVEFKTAFR